MPKLVTQMAVQKTRGPVIPQTVDLTPNTPKVIDGAPYWSRDEQFIVFHSNRVDLAGANVPAAGSLFHIYRMRPDGTNVTALTGPLSSLPTGANNSQTMPSFNSGASSIAYVETNTAGGVDLIELNLNTNTARSIVQNNPNGFAFAGLQGPSYGFAIGGNVGVLFSGQVNGGSFHLYSVDTQSGIVAQLTFGAFDDFNPILSPDPNKPVVAFDRGPAGQPSAPRDIYVIGTNPNVQNTTRITNFNAGGRASSNIQPAWSTDKIDQPTGSQHIVQGQQLLAFATTRVDSQNDGNANAVDPQGRHDIYWLKVTIALDPNNPSVFTVTTPESPTNAAYKLPTSDPQHIYDDTHPSWPQFIATYRVAYQSDRAMYDSGTNNSGPAGQPTDIFASTLVDLNAPSLIRFDEITGDVLRVEPRISAPGTKVKISAKVADFETGIRDIWLQIKNPNSKYQSADNKEHKVYQFYDTTFDASALILAYPYEYESQRIYIGNDPTAAQVYTYANPKYTASIADFFAFSGASHAPEAGWLQMSLESRDPVTGISTYSAFWTTDRYPTDYYIDLIAYDNAVNPFAGGGQSNWKIYDNVWGFTTQNFIPSHGILFVSDYSMGQKFFSSRFGTSTLANVAYTFWGTESWLTDYDVRLFPTTCVVGTQTGPIFNVANTLGVASFDATDEVIDPSFDDGTRVDGYPVPPTGTYDMWRIICRGAVPDSVLSQYVPHIESQPADKINGETKDRTVQVAPRGVFWNAAYAGGVFTGAGSLTDLTTQAQLHAFLMAGGRLFVNGQDVAWALTLGGATNNSFLTNDLKATYVSDDPGNSIPQRIPGGGFPAFVYVDGAGNFALTARPAFNPIVHDPWDIPANYISSNHFCYYGTTTPNCVDFPNITQEYVIGGIPTHVIFGGGLGDQFPDAVNTLSPGVVDFNYANTLTALQHYTDATTGQRVVYSPVGFEGINTDDWVTTGPVMHFRNRKAQIMHNAFCWMRTGSVIGTVRDVEGGNPLPNVLVRLANKAPNGVKVWAFTALSSADGSFNMNGVESGAYEISAVKPGYTIQKRAPTHIHGGFRDDIGLRMTKAEPSTIKGKVTRLDGVTPVVGAVVTATDVLDANVKFTGTTDANGNYTIDRVPSQTKYTLTCAATGYGASIPVSYLVQDPNDPSGQGLLQPATVYQPYDFKLKALPGSVTGFVFAKDAQGNKGAPIANATVTATDGTATVTAVTDANGAYSFNDTNTPPNGLDPGSAALVATAPGYAPNSPALSVTVVSGQNTVAADILLGTVLPGSVSGLVTRSSDGAPIPGVLIQLNDSSGNLITSTTTTTAQTDGTGYRFNYKISSVPAGVTYTVVASRTGFTPSPASQPATVNTGVETKNINFTMSPLHTFSANLSMVSTPYDYSGFDPVNDVTGQGGLLDIPQGDARAGIFMFASWDLGRYVFYPTPPANTFRLGRGYFLGYKQNMPLSVQGVAADPTRPRDIPLNAGWNMIGNPFLFDIDWTKVTFSADNGATWMTYQQAVSAGAVGSTLYGYLSGSYILSFDLQPWAGYWVKAYRNLVLRIDPLADGTGRAAKIPTGRAVLGGAPGWSVNLRLNIADTRDEDNHFGVSSRASEGFDGFKVEKPPTFGNRYSYLSFTHPNWGDKSGSYGVDVRSATTGTKTWEFSVQTTVAKSNATISWPNVATAPRSATLTITDLATGQSRDMRTSSSYSWPTGDTAGTRKFRIEASPRSGIDLRITDFGVHSFGKGGTAGITFNMSQSASVDIRVLNLNNTEVRRLTGRATRAAGINQLTWDQKSNNNVSVPSGVYLVEIKAQSQDGKTTVRQVAQYTVIR